MDRSTADVAARKQEVELLEGEVKALQEAEPASDASDRVVRDVTGASEPLHEPNEWASRTSESCCTAM